MMQAANCNAQIPAKAYEYLRAGRPMLALTDGAGDTADLMRRAGAGAVASLDSVAAMMREVPAFLERLRSGEARPADPAFTAGCSRRERTRMLASVFDSLK